MDELRDIKPLVPLSEPWPWWLWLLAALVLVGAVMLVWRKLRRKERAPAAVNDAEAARLALAAIRGTRPRDQAGAERLQSHIAVVLRRWIEASFDVHATEMTTEELTAEPRLLKALGEEGRSNLVALLAFADAVRFASRPASPDEHAESVERAWALVDRSPT
ncbi:MAG: hypothetical protein ACAI38_00840 [Myxococcota bacterium]